MFVDGRGATPRPPSSRPRLLHRYLSIRKRSIASTETTPHPPEQTPSTKTRRLRNSSPCCIHKLPHIAASPPPSFVHYALKRLPPSETPVPPAPAHLLVSHLAVRCTGAVAAPHTAGMSPPSPGVWCISTAELVLMLPESNASSDGHQPPTPLGRSKRGACGTGGFWVVMFWWRGWGMLLSGAVRERTTR